MPICALPVAHRGQDQVVLFDRGRQVGIAEKPPVALRAQHPVPDGVALAPVAAVAQALDAQAFRMEAWDASELFNKARGGVTAAVVHDQNLKRLAALGEVVERLAQRDRQALLLVVGGYNDGDGHCAYYGGNARRLSSKYTGARGLHAAGRSKSARARSGAASWPSCSRKAAMISPLWTPTPPSSNVSTRAAPIPYDF